MEATLLQHAGAHTAEEAARAEFVSLYEAKDFPAARAVALRCRQRGWTPLRWWHNHAMTYWAEGNFTAARHLYHRGAYLLDSDAPHNFKALYENGFALVLRALGETDPALIEYAGASYHFELAGEFGNAAIVENNVAYLLMTVGRLPEAVEAASRSIALHLKAGGGNVAEAWDTLEQIKRAIEDAKSKAAG